VLVTALEDGISPTSTWNGPPSLTIHDRRCETNGAPWTVGNYADESAGTMTLAQATAFSVNTIFAQVTMQVGPGAVADTARRMGIRSPLAPVCSIGLGTNEVSPLEMTSANSVQQVVTVCVPRNGPADVTLRADGASPIYGVQSTVETFAQGRDAGVLVGQIALDEKPGATCSPSR